MNKCGRMNNKDILKLPKKEILKVTSKTTRSKIRKTLIGKKILNYRNAEFLECRIIGELMVYNKYIRLDGIIDSKSLN